MESTLKILTAHQRTGTDMACVNGLVSTIEHGESSIVPVKATVPVYFYRPCSIGKAKHQHRAAATAAFTAVFIFHPIKSW